MRIVFDIECDNLLKDVTKIHCLSYYNLDTDTLHTITDYKEIKELILSCKELIGHNIVQYDIPVIEKILGIEVPDTIRQIDTLVLSWYLYDNREKHGLEKWGEDLGVEKPKIEDWSNLDISDYIHRCENDVKINVLLYKKEEALLNILYQENLRVKESVINYLTFKMKCLKMQNKNPIYIDMDRLERGLNELTQLENSKIEELKQVMPKVPIYTIKNKPKILYKKDGSLSSNGQKWFDLLKELNLPKDYESEVKILTGYNDGNPKSKQQLEEWLYLLGWKPLIYKDSETKNGVKKVAQIYNDKKEVCQSVKDLYSVEPKLENLENLGMIKHRLGVFKSFKEHQENGIVYSQAKGITSTYRIRHSSPFVNLAKPYLFYGKEIRALICIPNENYYLCGSDMKALEDTTKQHFMYYFDPKYVMEMRTPGFDPHLSIAEFGGLLSSEQVSRFKELKDKEQNDIEKEEFSKLNKQRNIAKVLNFSCLPVDNTEILTPSGYKTFYDLNVGDEIISYNTEKDNLEITKITSLPYYENADVINLHNSFFNFECTDNHRWFTFRRHKSRKKGTWWTKQFVYTKDLKVEDNMIVASSYKNNSSIYQDNDIELLAWILTEGWIKWSDKFGGTSNSKGTKRGVQCVIGQKKDIELLEKVLSNYEYSTYKRKDGLIYYHLKPKEIRSLFKRLNLPEKNKKDIDYTDLIFKMSYKQRELFINTMLLGDGHYQNNKLSEFSQNRGNILNSFTLALTLNGYYFSCNSKGFYKEKECVNVHIYPRKHITCQKIKQSFSRKTNVFCVNNINQTFIAKQNNKVVITGNSIYGAGPKKISESIGIDFETSKQLHTAYWERNKSVKQFSESLPIKVIFTNGVVKKYKSKELMNMSFTEQKEFNNLIESMWVQNPISKFWLYLRGVKDIFSAINQNSGVFCFDLYYKEVSKYFDIIFQYHDELAFYFEKSKYTKEEVTSILKGCIKRVNDILKLNVPLDVDAQYGDNYSETH